MRGAHNLRLGPSAFYYRRFCNLLFFNEIKRNRSACAFSNLLFSVCSSIVIMAAKRVSSKSVESFDETFNIFYSKNERLYTEIDNWSARINSLLELDIKKKITLSHIFPSSWNSTIFFRANLTSCIMVKLK
jgi:hypothetical protein